MREDFRLCLAEIAARNQQVGYVLQVLKESQLEDKTLTLFRGERGSAFPGAKCSCYNAGVRSALIARLPGKIPAGTRTDAIAMCADILRTLTKRLDPQQSRRNGSLLRRAGQACMCRSTISLKTLGKRKIWLRRCREQSRR